MSAYAYISDVYLYPCVQAHKDDFTSWKNTQYNILHYPRGNEDVLSPSDPQGQNVKAAVEGPTSN